MAIKCKIKPEYVDLAKSGQLMRSYAPKTKKVTNEDRYFKKAIFPTLSDLHKSAEYDSKNNSESNDEDFDNLNDDDEFEETEEDED